jgi:hypothetical protein
MCTTRACGKIGIYESRRGGLNCLNGMQLENNVRMNFFIIFSTQWELMISAELFVIPWN